MVDRWKSPCAALAIAVLLTACGGSKTEPPPPVQIQTAADEIIRVSEVWTSVHPEQGILSPPSLISVFSHSRKSRIQLTPTGASEVLTIEEDIQLRQGGEIHCTTRFEHPLTIVYGRRQGEAALQMRRPAISSSRSCNLPHPDGPLVESERTALFVLRADNLIAVEPPLEKRKYLPEAL